MGPLQNIILVRDLGSLHGGSEGNCHFASLSWWFCVFLLNKWLFKVTLSQGSKRGVYWCHRAFQGSVLSDKNTIRYTKLVSLPLGILVDSIGMFVGGHAIKAAARTMEF